MEWRILILVLVLDWSDSVAASLDKSICTDPSLKGQPCDPNGRWPRQGCRGQSAYFDCVTSGNGTRGQLVQYQRHDPRTRNRKKRQNGMLGGGCFYNTDCLSGMYCNAGRCVCMSNYIQRENFCYEKINPGQSGCVYNEQCAAVWARATCVNGVCACPSVQAVLSGPLSPVQTRDGVVCAADSYCPLPIDDGLVTVLEPSVAICTSAAECTQAPGMTAAGAETIGELYECSAISACCPNRAYTCSLPMGAPPSSGSGWWYNAATGQCQQITSGGSASINANNFATQDHCMSYCGSACPRGSPQYTNGRVMACNSGTTCDANFYCATVGSQQRCCPKASFVCSRNGGINSVPPSQTTEYNPGFQPSSLSNQGTVTRYYYDSQTRQCSSFAYLGAGGNFNNFATQADCQSFCVQQVLCSKGSPLTDANGQTQRCGTGLTCPVTHSCTNSVCCPTRQTICAQVRQQGTCSQFAQRFWYNSLTKQCEPFTFSGCQGNDNNFATLLECQSFCKATSAEPQCPQGKALRDSSGNFVVCTLSVGVIGQCPTNFECHFDGTLFGCCPSKAYTCSLSANSGVSCGPSSVRWTFDQRTQTCSSFTYFGCDGNSNNFPSREQCEAYCGAPTCPNGGQPMAESGARPQLCSSGAPCPNTHECTLFASSTSASVSYCCPSRAHICTQPPDAGQTCPGNSSPSATISSISRFYFSPSTKSCQMLAYNGCGGNANNFQTLQLCLTFCNSAACPTGQTAYVSPSTQGVLTCDPGAGSTCPNGYKCLYDTLWQRNVCCGSTDMGVCPAGERAYVEAQTNEARTCMPNMATPCPAPYLCRLSTMKNRYYCCSPPERDQCTSGTVPYMAPGTKEPLVCTVGGKMAACPSGYSCQTSGGHQGYCCTVASLCPAGYAVLQTSAGAQMCTVGAFSHCPSQYECMATKLNSTGGYCCTGHTANTSVCSTGTPYMHNQAPLVCRPMEPSQCPAGYQCLVHSLTNTYYCCGASSIDYCPTGSVYMVDDTAQQCSSAMTCPPGYTCTTHPTSGSAYCCSVLSSEVCGFNSTAYESAPGSPLQCDPSRDQCPAGFTCQLYAASSAHYCCKSAAVPCPKGGNLIGVNCSPNVPASCPALHSCQYIPASMRFQCCSGQGNITDMGTCLDGRMPYIDPATGMPKLCGSTVLGVQCPRGYSCQFSTTSASICCPVPAQGLTCPDGAQLHVTPQGQPVACENGQCPPGAACTMLASAGRYCCRVSRGQRCPPARRPYVSPRTNSIESCLDTCPDGYSCYIPAGSQLGTCCSNVEASPTYACQNGGRPFLYPPTQSPLACTPRDDQCPSGFACTRAANRQYYCCSSGTAAHQKNQVTLGCPAGMKPLIALRKLQEPDPNVDNVRVGGRSAKVQECVPSRPDSCPQPYQCVLAYAYSRFQCCADTFQLIDLARWRAKAAVARNARCPPECVYARVMKKRRSHRIWRPKLH